MSTKNNAATSQSYENLMHEYSILKLKHSSKIEAILILSKELENYRNERDQFKLMAEQLRERYSSLRKKVEGWGPSLLGSYDNSTFRDQRDQGLVQLLCELKEQNKSLKTEVENLRQKLSDSDGDIKLLREQIARQRVGSFDEGISNRSYPAHERETLVKDLEAAKLKCSMLETDLQAIIDEKEELVTTRDEYKRKVDRLNQQMNSFLKGDEKKLIDIDSVLMENRYLQERHKQIQEEKSMVSTTLSKYKSMLEKKKTRFSSSWVNDTSGTSVITHKQVQQMLQEDLHSKFPENSTNVAELRNLLVALYEALNDKKLALSHQKKANKILGTRVTELENKLRPLSSECGSDLHLSEMNLSNNSGTYSVSPSHSIAGDLSKESGKESPSFTKIDQFSKKLENRARTFSSGQSRTSSISSDQPDADKLVNDVFGDENLEKTSVPERSVGEESSPVKSADIEHKTPDSTNDDLPPSLQKLVNAALDDIDNDSQSAVIDTAHSEMKIVKIFRTDSSDSKLSISPKRHEVSFI